MTRLGKVVVTMAFTWSNRPVWEAAAARLVESDRGENLSPQHAPDRMAPAVRAGLMPMVSPMAMKAMPRVADTVQAEPREMATMEHRMHTKGRNISGVRNFRP